MYKFWKWATLIHCKLHFGSLLTTSYFVNNSKTKQNVSSCVRTAPCCCCGLRWSWEHGRDMLRIVLNTGSSFNRIKHIMKYVCRNIEIIVCFTDGIQTPVPYNGLYLQKVKLARLALFLSRMSLFFSSHHVRPSQSYHGHSSINQLKKHKTIAELSFSSFYSSLNHF